MCEMLSFVSEMWTYKHTISAILIYSMIFSYFGELKSFFKHESEGNFHCFDRTGDGAVICHFSDEIKVNDLVNVTKIKAIQNLTVGEIRMTSILGIHRFNMPEKFPSGLGGIFYSLEELFVSNSRLKFIHREGFRQMRSLFFLDLENNEIEDIPGDTFYDLKELVFLKLNGNKIKELRGKNTL